MSSILFHSASFHRTLRSISSRCELCSAKTVPQTPESSDHETCAVCIPVIPLFGHLVLYQHSYTSCNTYTDTSSASSNTPHHSAHQTLAYHHQHLAVSRPLLHRAASHSSFLLAPLALGFLLVSHLLQTNTSSASFGVIPTPPISADHPISTSISHAHGSLASLCGVCACKTGNEHGGGALAIPKIVRRDDIPSSRLYPHSSCFLSISSQTHPASRILCIHQAIPRISPFVKTPFRIQPFIILSTYPPTTLPYCSVKRLRFQGRPLIRNLLFFSSPTVLDCVTAITRAAASSDYLCALSGIITFNSPHYHSYRDAQLTAVPIMKPYPNFCRLSPTPLSCPHADSVQR